MGFIYIIVGTVFLFNPMIGLLDILPDFIGYLFILAGIYKIADITKTMDNIHKYLLYLIGISLARTILSVFMTKEDMVLSLIFVVLFSIGEAVLMIYFYNKLFNGFDDIGIRFENPDVFKKSAELKTLTYVFILLRSLFTVIPEFRYLAMTDYEGEISSFDMTGRTDYSVMLILLNVAVVTIIGVAWIYMMISYLNKINKNKPFIEKLNDYYINEVLSDTKRFFKRRIMISILLLIFGFIFIFDIFLDNIDVIPDFIGGGLILSAFIIMSKDNKNIKKYIYAAMAYIPVSIGNWIYRIVFAANEYRPKSLQNTDVLLNYAGLIAVTLVASLLLVIIFIAVRNHFNQLINEMIGFEYEEHFQKLIERQKESISKKNLNNTVNFIISLIFAISKIIQISTMIILPEYWMIHFVIEIAWVFRMYMFITDIYEEVKYRLDAGVE